MREDDVGAAWFWHFSIRPSGTISWSGRSLADVSEEEMRLFRRDVQVVFQDSYGSQPAHDGSENYWATTEVA